jgi:hypothetical protein
MSKSKSRKKRPPRRVLALPDLEHAKTAVLNSLTSASGQRTYDHAIREFVAWYCSEPPSRSTAPSCAGSEASGGPTSPASRATSRQPPRADRSRELVRRAN